MSKLNFAQALVKIAARLPSNSLTLQMKCNLGRVEGKADRQKVTYTVIHSGRGERVYTSDTLDGLVDQVCNLCGPTLDTSLSKQVQAASDAAVEPGPKELDKVKADDEARIQATKAKGQ